jgi:predicted SprT family Zn-dependent metalloprotease
MITEQEATLYIRMTLKQWNMSHIPFKWTNTRRTLGAYCVNARKIELSRQILNSFPLFKEVFLHELAHALDVAERNHSFRKNGRCSFHNRTWKKWCLTLGIPARRFIPAR